MKALLRVLIFSFLLFTLNLSAQESAIEHAPIGVMGDHYHEQGEFMISIRHMKMFMNGNLNGTNNISDTEIIELPNPYQMGNASTKLSVVPKDMAMDMTMLGVMYAPSDAVTLMAMGMFVGKDMSLDTYAGAMGMGMGDRTYLGSFDTSSSGLADLTLSALVRLNETNLSKWHAEFGIQKSVAESDGTDNVLTPMNQTVGMILPYGMQVGDGSSSLIAGLTYSTERSSWVYGSQIKLKRIISEDDWNFGNSFYLTSWAQKEISLETALSLRLTFDKQDPIDGRNSNIMAPIQTANPANYGGKVLELGLGINQLLNIFPGDHADRIGVELTYPISQDLNGPQMKSRWAINIGYQKSFF